MTSRFQSVALVLMSCFLFCCTKKNPASSAGTPTPTVPPNAGLIMAPGKCEKALEAIPMFDESAPMYPKIFAFYKDYAQCMDAGVATGMQSVVVNTLNKRWSELPTLAELSAKDAKFKDFVLSNLRDAVSEMTLEVSSIVTHAKNKCPAGQQTLCNEIKERAETALAKDIEDSEELLNSAPPPAM